MWVGAGVLHNISIRLNDWVDIIELNVYILVSLSASHSTFSNLW